MMEPQHQANQSVVDGLWFTHGLSVASFLLVCLTMMSGMLAQEPPVSQRKVLRMGFTDYPPFAYQEDGEFRGFDIEYIQAIAKEMGSTVEMVEFETIPQCLQGLQDGLIDMAAGGLSMTAEREMLFDFSHAYYESGLVIAARSTKASFMRSLLQAITDPAILLTLLGFLIFIVISGFVFWLCERRRTERLYGIRRGIGEGMWLSYATATTIGYGDVTPKTLLGRMATVPISLIGFIVIGSISGLVSSLMTIDQMEAHLQSLSDLSGRTVAYQSQTAGAALVQQLSRIHRFQLREVSNEAEAFELLEKFQVDAYINDAPGILHYINHQGKGRITLIGDVFRTQLYAIVMMQGNLELENIRKIQLDLNEQGLLDDIKDKYGI
jgi:polar amino acid transport system substrate-binding protein